MSDGITIVFCPRCGCTDARSVEPVGIELDRMQCGACGHSEICDQERIKDRWNDEVPRALLGNALPSHILPRVRFDELWTALALRERGWPVADRLRALHAEKHRAYHDASHLGACLRLVDQPEVKALAEHPLEVEAALWFHDAVYDPRASDNEDKSARLAEDTLGGAGLGRDALARIATHVRATKDHVAKTPDTQLVLDIDLSILGEPAEVYDRFEAAIRREYAWVPPEAYVTGRTAVLGRFLTRPSVYGTALFRERYEARARENLARAIHALSTHTAAS